MILRKRNIIGFAKFIDTQNKMATKLKKSKSAGRFGAKYGRSVRAKIAKIEDKQKQKQLCPFCGKLGVKRISKGIWKCPKCKKKFASNTFHIN